METKKATQVDGCNTCKKGLNKTQTFLLFLGFYILGTSVYGTVILIKNILYFF
jgi:hypothetical protein